MRKVFLVALALVVLLSGCRAPHRCVEIQGCRNWQAPVQPDDSAPERPAAAFVQALLGDSDEVRSARLKLAAAIILVGGEIALEILKSHH